MYLILCRKSVFLLLFLLIFFVGSIAGIFLFRCAYIGIFSWLMDYCRLFQSIRFLISSPIMLLHHLLWYVSVSIIGFSTWRVWLVPLCIFIRASVLCYFFCTSCFCGPSAGGSVIWTLVDLILFYYVCFSAYCGFNVRMKV